MRSLALQPAIRPAPATRQLHRRQPITTAAAYSTGPAGGRAAKPTPAARLPPPPAALVPPPPDADTPPDAFALLGLNRAASRDSVLRAYERLVASAPADAGYSEAALAARAVALQAAADMLLDPASRRDHEAGRAPLALPRAAMVGALILLQEGGATTAAALWGPLLLPSTPARLRRDVAVAAALAGVDDAADALARAGAAGARTAASRLAGAAAVLDAAGVPAAAAPPGLRAGIDASLSDIGPRAAVDTLAATQPGHPERAVAVDALARAAARVGGGGGGPSGPDPRRFGGLLAAAWPRLTPAEQAAVVGAGPPSILGPAGLDPAAATGARLVAAVEAGNPAAVAAAERALGAALEASHKSQRPAPSTRTAAAACRLLLGDPDGAAAALGLDSSPPADARLAEFVAAASPLGSADPLPGVCALVEGWLRGAARGAAPASPSPVDLSLGTWFGRPGVAARLAAAEGAAGLAAGARAAVGGLAGRLAGGVGRALGSLKSQAAGLVAPAAAEAPTAAAGRPLPRPRPTAAAVGAPTPTTAATTTTTAPPTTLASVQDETVGSLQARLLAAAAAAGQPGEWAEEPLPAGAIVPLAGEAPLWAVEAPPPATGARATLQSIARWAAPAAAVLAAAAFGAVLAPAAGGRLGAALSGLVAARVALPASTSSTTTLSSADALSLFSRFQAAKAAACGKAHAIPRLADVAGGKLLAEETARAATLAADGWAIVYGSRKPTLVGDGGVSTREHGSGARATFTVRAAEAATLRDGAGVLVDKVESADYTAVCVAERKAGSGEWKLVSVKEVE